MGPYSYTSYVPSALRREALPVRRYEPTQHAAVALAGLGFAIVVFTFLPAGLITAPLALALARVRAYERGVEQGRFDPSDRGHFTVARVLAWVSFVMSLPWVLAGGALVFLLLAR